MKTPSLLLITAALLAGLTVARAEEAPAMAAPSPVEAGKLLETPDLFPAAPAQPAASPAPTPAETGTAPAATVTSPVVPPAALKKGTAEQLRQAIRIRELKTEISENPEVRAQKTAADCAKTEEGRRVLMRNYYTLLYTKMEQADPSLREVLERQLHDLLSLYEQYAVRPSVLIEPVTPLPGSNSADHVEFLGVPDPAQPSKPPKHPTKFF